MISFRPKYEAKLTPKILKDIEKELAGAIGFEAHQRLCGVHKNTNNLHMHIAYNMIVPEKFTRYAPFYDHQKLHKICRELEKKYGLEIDKGLDDSRAKNDTKKHTKAETIEAQTGQQSFYNYVASRKKAIMDLRKNASSWEEIHENFLKIGMEIRPKGNGLVIKDRFGKHAIKASDIDRSLSKLQMEKSFGTFIETAKEQTSGVLGYLSRKAAEKYTAMPLHQHEKRDILFTLFRMEMERRKAALAAVKEEENEAYGSNKKIWDAQREHIEKYTMQARHRLELLQKIKSNEEAVLTSNRIKFAEKKLEIRKEIPYTSWTKFLQYQAGSGDETALEILRSKKLKPKPPVYKFNEKNENYEKYIAKLETIKLSQFQMEMEGRKEALDAVEAEEIKAFISDKKRWEAHRKNTEKYEMRAKHRQELLQGIKTKEDAELTANKIKFAEKKAAIHRETPYTSFVNFLQHQGALGDEVALEILKSKNIKPELSLYSNEKYIAELEAKKLSKGQQGAVISEFGINPKHKRALVAVIKMRELATKENEDIKHQISVNGTVIFTLRSGGTIRDTGKEIYFSTHDSQAQLLGEKYAKMKWGLNIVIEGNTCKFGKPAPRQMENQQSVSR